MITLTETLTFSSPVNETPAEQIAKRQKAAFGFELNKPLIDKKDFLLRTKEQIQHSNNTGYLNQTPGIKQSLLGRQNGLRI